MAHRKMFDLMSPKIFSLPNNYYFSLHTQNLQKSAGCAMLSNRNSDAINTNLLEIHAQGLEFGHAM